jgi:hypothetical protein
MPTMEHATTILHAYGASPEAVEHALGAIFANEDRAATFRLEGTFRAVVGRLTDPELEAAYRYLICRPHDPSPWTPVLELGNRTDGLEAELSRALGGAAIFTIYVYDDGLSGYRFARGGKLLDSYVSDPTYFASEDATEAEVESRRAHPARLADLLPAGTMPEDFARVVLNPGWWEEHDQLAAAPAGDADAEGELVDETDRMRCIALALELWGPSDYPFSQDLAELPNQVIGPVIAVAFA